MLASALLGVVALRLRQPLIVVFILVGLVAGPSALGLVTIEDELELLAEIGIALLLFAVGLRLDLHVVRALGPVAVVVGCVQMAITAALGFAIATALGFGAAEAGYLGAAIAFSSTVVIVKLLSDSREIEQLHGRVALGVLIVQDLAVIALMVVVTAIGAGEDIEARVLDVGVAAIAFVAALVVLMRWVLPPVLHRVAHSPEVLILFAIAWAISLAAAADAAGFVAELGAFAAGVALASTPYREAIAARLVGVRDFLLVFFFVVLGARLEVGAVTDHLGAVLALAAVVLVVKPVLVGVLVNLLGYSRRVSLYSALPLAQTSEFSLILLALGAELGHVDVDAVTVVTALTLVTIAISIYLSVNARRVETALGPALRLLRDGGREEPVEREERPEMIVVGLGRFGGSLVERLTGAGVQVLGVDFDPRALRHWELRGVPTAYGDAEDPELAGTLPLASARWVVSTVRDREAGLALLHGLRHHRFQGSVAAAADSDADARALEAAGVDLALRPFDDAAEAAVARLRGDQRDDDRGDE